MHTFLSKKTHAYLRLVGDHLHEARDLHVRAKDKAVIERLAVHELAQHARVGDEARNGHAEMLVDLEDFLLQEGI